ncbi:hypothetical protein RBH94_12255 [Aestuariibaculum sp. YM273]|uniref:hypothetical protein n=1 Tax=Aestuariibaculum sp. YM273 TaxID=3070659 RepID=UPI0027DC5063|nr:hypothetical protein [Aestuariibaculum sp. YM273]WMI64831.1 hypothetical protein RBH94_12255 [Aestuariibaculum sp. YM273]
MKYYKSPILILLGIVMLSCSSISLNTKKKNTNVSIKKDAFYINNQITYKNRYWNHNKIEGLLFNSRMVQGIFDDLNPVTRQNFIYPDTKIWDAERNTNEFVKAMPTWKSHGLLAFTLNLQGGSPTGYGNKDWENSAFDHKGNLRHKYMHRLEKILDTADRLNMLVILGYFYFGQDQFLTNEEAIINAVDNITVWILKKGYKNILVEINNECDIHYDHDILKPKRVPELIKRVKNLSKNELLVSTSYRGNRVPSDSIIKHSDFILLHGNGANPEEIKKLVNKVKSSESYTTKPIVFNEDDHYDFNKESNNLQSAIESYASWGYFDFRRDGESFNEGFQSVPVDWGINSARKKSFFKKLKDITNK